MDPKSKRDFSIYLYQIFSAMKIYSIAMLSAMIFFFISKNTRSQVPDWRFGFEYDDLPAPFTSEENHDTLLSRLSYVSAAQQTSAINVNGNGWAAMQPNETSAIDFNESDGWVKRFQDANFELMYYLTPNTSWSHSANNECIDGPGDDECAPDDDHWQDWIDYVKAIVERYDGDGVNDMVGLVKPVRFYILPQEVCYAGNGGGDADDADGIGFWDDNMQHLIKVHKVTYEAIHDADPSGNSKLVGSGAWFLDLYSDFPDYPDIEGPTVQARLNGQNLFGSTFQKGFDSIKVLLQGLADTSDGKKCDYIGWHPHTGWKSTDQSFKFVKSYAPGYPIFVDDMWCAMLTSWDGLFFILKDGYCQFIGGDSIEGDFPTSSITSYQNLFNGLDSGDTLVTNWYNAKTAREAVKCFATAFGEGAERVDFSMSNDINPDNILLYSASQPYRYTGMVERKDNNYAPKPVMYTMRLLVDMLYDFTSVEKINVSSEPRTRVYKFNRLRGTSCYVCWSETGWNTETPEIPNGETLTIPVVSDTLTLSHIVTQPGVTQPSTEEIISTGGDVTIQLGFEPFILEEHDAATTINPVGKNAVLNVSAFPNPSANLVMLQYSLRQAGDVTIRIFDLLGREMLYVGNIKGATGDQQHELNISTLSDGSYLVMVTSGNLVGQKMIEKISRDN